MEKNPMLRMLTCGLVLIPGVGMSASRPNIVVILCDDMGYSDLGCYGSEIRTPNIDRLAAEGARFTQFYANPRSCPSRASLLTGMYPHRTGVGFMSRDFGIPGYHGYLGRHCVTMAEALKGGGYETFISGKWHLGSAEGQRPDERGFDRSWVFLGGATDYYEPREMMENGEPLTLSDPEFYMTDAISEHAVQYIREAAHAERPFFLYVAYTAPHWPLQAPREMIERYRRRYASGWDRIRRDRFARQKSLGLFPEEMELPPRPGNIPDWESLSPDEQRRQAELMAIYAAVVERMDFGVGRILSTLREEGTERNTVVVFMSDNGASPQPVNNQVAEPGAVPGGKGSADAYGYPWANVSSVPLRAYKRWTYEGGIRVPCIVRYPSVVAGGSLLRTPAHAMDWLPTFLEIAAIPYPADYAGAKIEPMDGISLSGVWSGVSELPGRLLFWEHSGCCAVRHGRWKLVRDANKMDRKQAWELYDVEWDPAEQVDLSAASPEIVKELSEAYGQWAARCGVIPHAQFKKLKRLHGKEGLLNKP